MSRLARRIAWMALLPGLAGCASMGLGSDVQQTERQLASLNQRVEQLEAQRGVTPPLGTGFATESDQEPQNQAPASGGGFQAGSAFTKLARGLVNIVTGWVEIPKRIQETSMRSGPWAGFTWGLLRGVGYGFIRTAGGVYETVTFPVPAPADYRPIMVPEYVFLPEG